MIVNKSIAKMIATILFAILYALITKYTSVDIAILCLLIQIYIELLLKDY